MDAFLAVLVSLTAAQWAVIGLSCLFSVTHLLDESGLWPGNVGVDPPLWTATARWHGLGDIGWAWGFAGLFVQTACLCALAVSGALGNVVALSILIGARLSDTVTTHVALSVWHGEMLPGTVTALVCFVPEVVFFAAHWEEITSEPLSVTGLFVGLMWFPLTWSALRALGSIAEAE